MKGIRLLNHADRPNAYSELIHIDSYLIVHIVCNIFMQGHQSPKPERVSWCARSTVGYIALESNPCTLVHGLTA